MPQVAANGLKLEYDATGNATDPAMLLIMGLGAQMVVWPDEFVGLLAARGFYVVRYDNRDIGLSTWLDELGTPDIAGALAKGTIPPAAYTLADMADDAAGLLDALGIDRAHVVGASMGGMIAQTFALRHAERTITLTSIMSTTGDRSVGQPRPEVAHALFFSPRPTTREEAIAAGVEGARMISSPGYPFDEERVRSLAGQYYDRGYHPDGMLRQALAVLNQEDRTSALAGLSVPTLVIHGDADPLVDVSGGRATASALPGAELWLVPGMGHDLPPQLFVPLADRIAAHCRTA